MSKMPALSPSKLRTTSFRAPAPVSWKEKLLEAMEAGELPTSVARRLNVHNVTLYRSMREDVEFAAKYARAKQVGKLAKFARYTDGSGDSPLAEGPRQGKFLQEIASGESLPSVLLRWSITHYAVLAVVRRDPRFREEFIQALQAGVRAKWEGRANA